MVDNNLENKRDITYDRDNKNDGSWTDYSKAFSSIKNAGLEMNQVIRAPKLLLFSDERCKFILFSSNKQVFYKKTVCNSNIINK